MGPEGLKFTVISGFSLEALGLLGFRGLGFRVSRFRVLGFRAGLGFRGLGGAIMIQFQVR